MWAAAAAWDELRHGSGHVSCVLSAADCGLIGDLCGLQLAATSAIGS
jgi:hypothetical protein